MSRKKATLRVPISTYIFSRLIIIHLLTPLTPNIHIEIIQTGLYTIPYKDKLREFDKRSKHFLLGDHFTNSYNLISWQCMDIVRRKLMLVTIATERVKELVKRIW